MHRGLNWGIILQRYSEKYCNKIAFIHDDVKFTYRELFVAVNQIANMLSKLDVKKGDRVCIYLPNCWQHIIGHFGVLRTGAIVIPLNSMYKAREIQYMIKDSEARTIITNQDLSKNVHEIWNQTDLKNLIVIDGVKDGSIQFDDYKREPNKFDSNDSFDEREDLCLIQYTSGTTGEPKGAMLTYHNILSNLRTQTNLFCYDETDAHLLCLPLFHSFGIFSVYYSIFTGGLLVLMSRFDAEMFLCLIEKYKITRFNSVPPMLLSFLKLQSPDRFDLSSLRHCLCGAAVMPVEVMQKVKSIIGIDVVDGYGCTEAYGFIMTPYKGLYKHGSIGIPTPLQEVKIVNDQDEIVSTGTVGEIVTRGPIVMKGYWNKPTETSESMKGGWFHTGDLAYTDNDGYFYIVGRKKEMIISSGFNIYPKEIEELLYQHPKIADAAVIGVPHEYKGEAVKAIIVLKDGKESSENEIIEYCRKTLAVYKAPTRVEFRKELPRTPSGKVLKRLLK